MATEREIQETIARCVSIMVFYHNSGRTAHTREQTSAEISAVSHTVKSWAKEDEIRRRILDSVNDEMIVRYGPELGVRLDGEFYKMFVDADLPVANPSPSEIFRRGDLRNDETAKFCAR